MLLVFYQRVQRELDEYGYICDPRFRELLMDWVFEPKKGILQSKIYQKLQDRMPLVSCDIETLLQVVLRKHRQQSEEFMATKLTNMQKEYVRKVHYNQVTKDAFDRNDFVFSQSQQTWEQYDAKRKSMSLEEIKARLQWLANPPEGWENEEEDKGEDVVEAETAQLRGMVDAQLRELEAEEREREAGKARAKRDAKLKIDSLSAVEDAGFNKKKGAQTNVKVRNIPLESDDSSWMHNAARSLQGASSSADKPAVMKKH